VQQVVRQLEKGEAMIVFDPVMEACNITTAAQAQAASAHTEID